MKRKSFFKLSLTLSLGSMAIIMIGKVVSIATPFNAERAAYAQPGSTMFIPDELAPNDPPTAPQTLTAQVVSETQIDLSWIAATDDVAVSGYRLYRRQMNQENFTLVASIDQLNNYTDNSVSEDITYEYAVSAFDAEDNESEKSQVVTIWCKPGAKTVWAEDLSEANVQKAFDDASDGDTVMLPPGTATWNSTVVVDEKAITISGAGMEQTTIVDGTDTEWNDSLLWVESGSEEKLFRITGVQFKEINNPTAIYVWGKSKGFRVDHCRFFITDQKGVGVMSTGGSTGVVDHCEFFNSRVVPLGDKNDWGQPLSLGLSDGIYVEDCTYNRTVAGNSVDGHVGGHYVFRKNTINDSGTEVHGFCCNLSRGYFMYEIYENNFGYSKGITWGPICSRGGTGVIFGNTLTGDIQPPSITVYNDRSMGRPNGDYGVCDGSNPVDGNEDDSGYPCLDQIGRATDLGPNPGVPQLLEPLYEWDNFVNGNNMNIEINPSIQEPYASLMKRQIQKNRDYYDDTHRPGYQPYQYPHPFVLQFPPAPKTDFNAPSVPGNLHVTEVLSRTVSLSWNASTDTGGSGLAGYYIWLDGKRVTSNSDPNYTQYTFLGLKEGQTYHCQVSALDAAGNESAPTAEMDCTPGSLNLVLYGTPANRTIHLAWNINISIPTTTTWTISYEGTPGEPQSPITDIPEATRSYSITDLTNYELYNVTINAMLDNTVWLSDTVQVMPTDRFIYQPLIERNLP